MKNLIADDDVTGRSSAEASAQAEVHQGGRTSHPHKDGATLAWLSILSILTLLSICWMEAGCSRPEPSPLRVGSLVWPGYEPFYTARQLGYLDEKQVRLMEYTSTSETIRAFSNGTIEAGMMTLDEALLLAQDVPDIRLVLVLDYSNGADMIMARPEIAGLKDLKGRRVGADTSAMGAYMLMRALQLADLTPQELEIVPLAPTEHEAAFTQGLVDAVVTGDPTGTKLRNFGARQIFDSSQIPGEIVDVLVVRDAYLQAHLETVKHLLQAYYRARVYCKEKPQEAAEIAALRAKISPQEFLSSLDGLLLPEADESRRMLMGKPPVLLKNAQTLAAVMREKGLLRKDVDIQALFDERTLARLLP
ncbi:MAG: ABC-type nitrate/sulfonate/bicarbonate transport system protein [Akkermansiaceae bacterium]|nr:ABC-type nitrate/sulfonate/bicarbonate transport system protein [Akkermansiaceae bacterium]